MKRLLITFSAILASATVYASDVPAAVPKHNPIAIGMFLAFVVFTLFVTRWAARKNNSVADHYAAGGKITGFQNGWAIAGDYMSAASLLGISALVFTSGFDGLIYSIGFLASWPIILFLIAEPLRTWALHPGGRAVVQVEAKTHTSVRGVQLDRDRAALPGVSTGRRRETGGIAVRFRLHRGCTAGGYADGDLRVLWRDAGHHLDSDYQGSLAADRLRFHGVHGVIRVRIQPEPTVHSSHSGSSVHGQSQAPAV
jgi:hypothetical protein